MTVESVNPFDQLMRAALLRQTRPRLRTVVARDPARENLTRSLVEHLRRAGPAPTSSLCHVVDREPRLVWGLLKGPRQSGEVTYADGLWSVSVAFDESLQAELAAAAALLRRHGWVVRRVRGIKP
jgi:hypothetical protein